MTYIYDIRPSNRATKRYKITMTDGKTFHFGLKNGSTYIDHQDEGKRNNYIARHMGNKTEYALIMNLIPSPALFSYAILWGESTKLEDNVENLNKLFLKKYGTEKIKYITI